MKRIELKFYEISVLTYYCSSICFSFDLSLLSNTPTWKTNDFVPLLLNGRTLTATFILSVDILFAVIGNLNNSIKLSLYLLNIHPLLNVTKYSPHRAYKNTTRRFHHIREKRYSTMRVRSTNVINIYAMRKLSHGAQPITLYQFKIIGKDGVAERS